MGSTDNGDWQPSLPAMEPLHGPSNAFALRTTSPTPGELSALLRDGRVLAAVVLEQPGSGSVLIGIGRHRVPAQTNLRLEPGNHLLVRVEQGADQVVLRILKLEGGSESAYMRALRAVIGEGRPLGQLLHGLAARLREELARPGRPLDELQGLLARLEGRVAGPGTGAAGLARLLQGMGLGYEAALVLAVRTGLVPEVLERIGADLKGQLLRALGELPGGAVRDAVARALLGLEAEQLLNLARQEAGEPQAWSFPILDGSAWSTAHLLVHPHARDEASGDDAGAEQPRRLVLGLELSNVGPIRADLTLSARALTVRLLVTRDELAARIFHDAGDLRERLGEGRPVELSVRVGTAEEARVAQHPLDTRILRDRRLMDVRG